LAPLSPAYNLIDANGGAACAQNRARSAPLGGRLREGSRRARAPLGADSGTAAVDCLDLLATLIGAWEAEHHPFDPPDPHRGDQLSDGAGRSDPQV